MRLQKLWNPVWERYSRLKAQDINTYKRLVGITVLFLLLYVAAWVSAGNGWQIAAGGSLGLTGFLLAVLFYRESRWILDSRVLLSLFWLGGEGVAALQLSRLQTPWTTQTWIAFGLFYLTFLWGRQGVAQWCLGHRSEERTKAGQTNLFTSSRQKVAERVYHCIVVVVVLSFLCFWTEVVIMGYIPLFSKDTHAYNYFHVTGLHYVTFSCMLVHPLTLIYLMEGGARGKKRIVFLILWNVMALSIPLLCISKFQFILTILLPIMVYLLYHRQITWKRILAGAAAVFVLATMVFLFMTARRNYEAGYLNGIFQMKNQTMPLSLQYVYIYIANNYDNFNCLTQALAEGSASYLHGLKELFPVFALTGLKFVFPGLVSYPTFFTIEELNTLTILYDTYYDFGLIGVALFGAVLGAACNGLESLTRTSGNPVGKLFYGQMTMYLLLSFFSTWFSNPTTWFWFGVTWLLFLYVGGYVPGQKNR